MMGRGRVPKGVKAGQMTYFGGAPTILWDNYGSKLIVGAYSSISAGVTFFLGGHHFIDRISTRIHRKGRSSYSKGDIVVGSDVWIGHGAVILDGVTIGDGAVVGAYAVVASDVEPYAVVIGNPARVVKMRFDEATREALLRIKWWDWPKEKMNEASPFFRRNDVKGFVKRYG